MATINQQPAADNLVPPRWRRPALAAWLLLAGAMLTTYLADLPLTYRLIAAPCSGAACHYQAITQAEVDVLAELGLSTQFYATYVTGITVITVLVFAGLALLILIRRSRTRMGLLASFTLLIMPTVMITNFDIVAAAYPRWAWAITAQYVLGQFLIFLFILSFPTGRFNPRWSFLIPVIAIINALQEINSIGELTTYSMISFLAIALITTAVVVYRYRRIFTPGERRQSKWALLGLLGLFSGVFVWGATYEWLVFPAGRPQLLLLMGGWAICQVTSVLLPSGLAVSILRHQLWDIDLIIRRTAIYGLLTALLALVYYGTVLSIQQVLTLFNAGQSPLSIVVSTLLTAALFNPLRARVQRFIDRRFFRARYDARLTLERFAAAARDEVDLGQLTAALEAVVGHTMQPVQLNLWLKDTRNE